MGLIGRTTASPPPAVEEFCRTHEPLIGATVNLDPEYGVPLALQAVGHLCSRFPRVGLVLIGLDHSAAESLPDLADVREHVLLPGTLSPDVTLGVMKRLGVFLRPTYFDGDSVSVREALALGIPVVASDTGFRPEGVHRFKVGDRLDLCERLEAVLVMAGGEHERRQGAIQPEGHAPTIVALYRQL